MKKIKILLSSILVAVSLALSSCAGASGSTEGNFIRLVLLQGNGEGGEAEFIFTMPIPSSQGIYAETTSSAGNVNARRYQIQAYSAYAEPYQTCQVYLEPGYTDPSGTYIAPKARLTFTEFTLDDSDIPLTRTFELGRDAKFNQENYHVPMGRGGKLTVKWSTSDPDGVPATVGTSYAVKSYALKELCLVSTLK